MNKLKTLALAAAAMISMQASQAQTADDVVNKYIEALGGKEKLMSLKSVKMTGGLSVQGMDIGITVTILNGVGSRNDISVPGMGEGYQIMTPTKGWSYMPFQGQTSPEEVSEDRVKSSQAQLDLQGALLGYKEKGHQVELLGKETVDGAECFKLKLTNKNGKVSTLFIDTKTYYRIKSISTTNINGEDTEIETSYSDFRKTPEGFVFPFSQTTPNGPITYSSIEVNKPVDESIFVVK
jgi:hypothetical protein